jgi:hypothetical protein
MSRIRIQHCICYSDNQKKGLDPGHCTKKIMDFKKAVLGMFIPDPGLGKKGTGYRIWIHHKEFMYFKPKYVIQLSGI